MNIHATQIIKRLTFADHDDPYVIGVAGGSASGKSWFSALLCEELNAQDFDCIILHQDDFAIGRAFKDKNNSPYRWDDPSNYRLDEAFAAAEDVLAGDRVSFLAYTLSTHMPSQPTSLSFGKSTARKKVLIVEGLFAWTHGFEKLVDEKVFLETNFFHSFVLRLNRNITDNKTADFETVVRQYFTHVAIAYYDLCLPMKKTADMVIRNNVDISKLRPSVQLTYKEPMPNSHKVYQDSSVAVRLGDHTSSESIIEVANPRGVLFREVVATNIAERIKHYAALAHTS